MNKKLCDIGLIGLGVMGRNFALNMSDKGFRVSVYNRTGEKTREFVESCRGNGLIEGFYELDQFIKSLKSPRALLIFVTAGNAVDGVIEELVNCMDPDDLVVDCGNSHFRDTDRRSRFLTDKGFLYLGMGVSGGESGARHGPSMMPGGSRDAYNRIAHIIEPSAAQAKGEPCVAYMGVKSAGHYVKMVHNGIEYGIMELIAESYDLMRRGLGYSTDDLSLVIKNWNSGKLNSYLIEITSRILEHRDENSGKPIVDIILDRARQKGTGEWACADAMELQVPLPTVNGAVSMRNMSDLKEEREKASGALSEPTETIKVDKKYVLSHLEEALFASIIITFAQGFALLKKASMEYGYDLNLETVAKIWRGGCIIRANLLEDIKKAFQENSGVENLLLSPLLGNEVSKRRNDLQIVIHSSITLGIPVPGFMSALAYYDAYRSKRLPANLIMAQRDYFGSHRYERTDEEGTFHTKWEA
jgi:6-phosphogluconate dehydrogenase